MSLFVLTRACTTLVQKAWDSTVLSLSSSCYRFHVGMLVKPIFVLLGCPFNFCSDHPNAKIPMDVAITCVLRGNIYSTTYICLIGIVGGMESNWVHSALRSPLAYCASPRWLWWWRNWWNDWQGKPKYSEETCPSVALSITNPTCLSTTLYIQWGTCCWIKLWWMLTVVAVRQFSQNFGPANHSLVCERNFAVCEELLCFSFIAITSNMAAARILEINLTASFSLNL
jgi:hypothetical protein